MNPAFFEQPLLYAREHFNFYRSRMHHDLSLLVLFYPRTAVETIGVAEFDVSDTLHYEE